MLKFFGALLATVFMSLGTNAHTLTAATKANKKNVAIRKESAKKKTSSAKKKSARKSSKTKVAKSKSTQKYRKTRKKLAIIDPFTRNMGSLVWPMEEGNIKTSFGPYKVGLGAVTGNNPGLTLEGTKDAEVKSAFDGIVSGVFDIEGNKAIVVRHGNYLTVYGNLASINVGVDDKINAGEILGKAANNDDGNSELEFLLMRKNQNIDPEPWMKRK